MRDLTMSGYYFMFLGMLLAIIFCFFIIKNYQRRWIKRYSVVSVKCTICKSITEVRREKFSFWFCNYCQHVNYFTEKNKEYSKIKNLNDMSTYIDNITLHHKTCLENSINNSDLSDDVKCNGAKVMLKKIIKDKINLRVELVETKKKLYMTEKRLDFLIRELNKNIKTSEKSFLSQILNDVSLIDSNVRKRASYFSSTLLHPIKNLDDETKEANKSRLEEKLKLVENKIRFLEEQKLQEAKLLENSLLVNNSYLQELENLKKEFGELSNISRFD